MEFPISYVITLLTALVSSKVRRNTENKVLAVVFLICPSVVAFMPSDDVKSGAINLSTKMFLLIQLYVK